MSHTNQINQISLQRMMKILGPFATGFACWSDKKTPVFFPVACWCDQGDEVLARRALQQMASCVSGGPFLFWGWMDGSGYLEVFRVEKRQKDTQTEDKFEAQ